MFKSVKRSVFFLILALLAVAVAVTGFVLALRARTAQPVLVSSTGDPAEAIEHFLDTLCSGDYAAASALCAGGLPAEEVPQDAEAAALYDCMKQSWSWKRAGEIRTEGIYAYMDVELTTLDTAAMTADMNADVNTVLARYVEEAEHASDIYDENDSFRDEVVQRAWNEVWAERLSRAPSLRRSAQTEMTVRYSDAGWVVVPGSELLTILSGNF